MVQYKIIFFIMFIMPLAIMRILLFSVINHQFLDTEGIDYSIPSPFAEHLPIFQA